MGNARSHPLDLSYEEVQIEFLPANTKQKSLIQPFDHGIICAFILGIEQHLVKAMDSHNFSVKEFWCKFTIKRCQVIQKVL